MKNFYTSSIEQTLQTLKSDVKNGLHKDEIYARQQQNGLNRLEEKQAMRWYHMLAQQFASVLILILVIAAALSVFLGDIVDALAILAIIVLNGILGFIQEWKAETAIKSLKQMLSPSCTVIRDGQQVEIEAEKLVPGDYVVLNTGGAVPADIRLTEVTNLRTDEAALTGESTPVGKITEVLPEETPVAERRNMAFMGTHIVNGHGHGLVVATGMETEFGRIAGITSEIKETKTRLQRHLTVLGRQLGVLTLFVSAAVVVVGVLSGKDMLEMFMTGVSLAVAAVPEGLPAVVTITLAVGVSAMARRKALLRHMQAAETLGAVSVICTDKTGTLTKNEMTVQKIWTASGEFSVDGSGYKPEGNFLKDGQDTDPRSDSDLMVLLDTGRKCNTARIEKDTQGWRAVGSPTEGALIVVAEKAGLEQDHQARIVAEHSFNSSRKRMSVVEETEEHLIVHVKGAPEALLPLCTHFLIDGEEKEMADTQRRQIEEAYTGFAEQGLRTLALARKTAPKDADMTEETAETGLTFLGVTGVIDPPRPEVAEALEKAQKAGIKVVVITGDSPLTARAIAAQIGLKVDKALTSSEIKDMSDEALADLLKQDILFARTVPEDKFRIVKLLQAQDRLTAMTGDGVNDAPALKQADIGIAMGIRGTDVAKGVADMVLSDDNFASIIAAIEEGRRQYANIRKFVRYLLSSNVGEVVAIFINIMLGWPLILLPVQILWMNLVTDGVTAVALGMEKAEKDVMNKPPRPISEPILDKGGMMMIAILGGYIGLGALLIYHHYMGVGAKGWALANTAAFTGIVVMEKVNVLNFRNLHGTVASMGWLSNPWLLTAIIFTLGLQVAAVYVPFLQNTLNTAPLGWHDWGVIVLMALPLFFVPEVYKAVKSRW